jgi:hypothetical protein
MRTLIGIILTLAGAAIILYGLGSALIAFAGLYQGALDDAMNQPEGTEKAVSDAMWRNAIIGAAGIPFFLVGSFLTGRGLLRKIFGGQRG